MKFHHIAGPTFSLLLLLSGTTGGAVSTPVSLKQCFEWTKSRSEELKIRQENVRQSQAQARAFLGRALPDIRWKFTETWQQPEGIEKLEQQGFAGFVEKEQTESKFSLEQPLFSGLREFSARSASLRETVRNSLLLERAAQQLFERTATVFYAVIENETNQANTRASLELAEDRYKETQGFLRLGKSNKSDVYTAKAQVAALRAQVDQFQGRINAARQELSYLTGQDLMTTPLLDEIPSPPTFVTVEEAVTSAKERTDLRAQREDVAAQKLRIRYERGFYWPTADVTGNYFTERATFLDEIDWDVVLSVEVPLFQGGIVSANVDAAKSAYQESRLVLEQLERIVEYEARRVHSDLTSAVQEVQSLEEAAQAAQQGYDALRREYGLGLVTNLDVIQALDRLQAQKTARDAARLKAKRLFLELNVVMEKTL